MKLQICSVVVAFRWNICEIEMRRYWWRAIKSRWVHCIWKRDEYCFRVACASIQANNIVQHLSIRLTEKKKGFPWIWKYLKKKTKKRLNLFVDSDILLVVFDKLFTIRLHNHMFCQCLCQQKISQGLIYEWIFHSIGIGKLKRNQMKKTKKDECCHKMG